ncbi:hypothetical protein H8K35_02835 [Undibacterium sp. LX40W]|uniref:Uncharacterized protein n=1 Tax=Undibacterium nitidum TaxID=2762298 RepID=A0A923KKD7_9BURK|nr:MULTISPECIES: hypothetical protein [Undibacterium]MBC3880680.1 hypothetical protein [Undibacterium nitidum]MBC3890585.1 hypothetical protein [Undibacterium sp. LX40W]
MQTNTYSPPVADVEIEPAKIEVPDIILKRIKNAWITGIVSGSITLIFTLIAMNGSQILGFSIWNLSDVALIFGLTFGIYKKSRACAVAMLAYFLLSKIIVIAQTGSFNGGILAIVFIYYYVYGVIGTFAYHKHLKENQ